MGKMSGSDWTYDIEVAGLDVQGRLLGLFGHWLNVFHACTPEGARLRMASQNYQGLVAILLAAVTVFNANVFKACSIVRRVTTWRLWFNFVPCIVWW
jgi:hypothetical protein